MSIAILFSFVIFFTSASEFIEDDGNLCVSAITAELSNIMTVATVNEKIPVQIWTQEVDVEAVEAAALKETGLNRDKIREMVMNGEDERLTMDDMNSYIAAERRIYAEMQSVQNEDFLASFPSVISANKAEEAFVSRYSPMIAMELTSSEIKTLSLSEKVESICYAPEIEIESEMRWFIQKNRQMDRPYCL